MSYQIEICANSVQSAINAEKGGANRVELCDNLWEGGTTPSYASIALAKKYIDIPVFVLIRPRGGDFVYNDLEFETIKQDISIAKLLGIAGVVSGVLTPEGSIDVDRTAELVKISGPLPFTFHRAFDHVKDIQKSISQLTDCGVARVLTSGQGVSVDDGLDNLKKMIEWASDRLTILPGGGINRDNVSKLYTIGCREFHFSAKSQVSGLSKQKGRIPMNGSKDIPEDTIQVSDPDIIVEIKRTLDEMA